LESGSEDRGKKTLIISAMIGFLVLVGIISQVTVRALGERMEASIVADYERLEAINSRYTERIAEISPGTDTLQKALKEIITRYFNAKIGSAHEWEVFNWLETQQVPVSDFRHDKIMDLIHQGRKEYRDTVISIRKARDSYREALASFYSGLWLRLNGFPRIDVEADPIRG